MVKSKIGQFKVKSYKLLLNPGGHSAQLSISGQRLGPPSHRLTLRQKGLKIRSASITHTSKNKVVEHEIVRINHLPTLEQVRLHTRAPLYPGEYSIVLEFEGAGTDRLKTADKKQLSHHSVPLFEGEQPEVQILDS